MCSPSLLCFPKRKDLMSGQPVGTAIHLLDSYLMQAVGKDKFHGRGVCSLPFPCSLPSPPHPLLLSVELQSRSQCFYRDHLSISEGGVGPCGSHQHPCAFHSASVQCLQMK